MGRKPSLCLRVDRLADDPLIGTSDALSGMSAWPQRTPWGISGSEGVQTAYVTRTLALTLFIIALAALFAFGVWRGYEKTGDWRFMPSGPPALSTGTQPPALSAE